MTAKPRALILDLFGDYLRYVDAGVRLSHLTELLGAFAVPAATARVTMSRLRREDWFVSRRIGRETVYRLTPELLAVLDEGRTRIFAAPAPAWDEVWTMVIYQMNESERPARHQLRKTLAWNGFGPLTTSTWLAPGDRRAEARALVDDLTDEPVDVLSCRSEGLEHDRDLARRCWDLEGLAGEYAAFNATHRHLARDAQRLTGAAALVRRTEVISTYRHFPFRDPMLPEQLRPARWPGTEAFTTFHSAHAQLGPAARAYVGSVIGTAIDDPARPGRPDSA